MSQNNLPNSRKVRIVLPYPITHRFKVQDEFVGKSLLEMMSIRFPFRPMSEWKQRILDGKVGINEDSVLPDFKLSKTDQIFHHNPKVIEPSVPDEVQLLKQTDDWLAVYKPAPLPMHPGGRYFKNTLTSVLEDLGQQDLKIVHRLDAVTSGIVLFAKNKSFAKRAMEAFQFGKVNKTYFAEVSGVPEESGITIDSPIRRKTGFVFETNPDLSKAKPAVTHFTVINRKRESTIVKCNPVTGRTHQIRLHLEKWGYPIIDDPIYGIKGDKSSKQAQKSGIRLVNAALEIEDLDINLSLKSLNKLPSWATNA